MEDRNIAMARRVAAAVAEKGGRTYYVGGLVRDWLLGRENKDVDIEVHGIEVQQLEAILDSLGERLTMGASFGIMGLRHWDLDIAMPRSEVATGRGHKDFGVFVDPFIGAEKAATRRDFTMNALMQDVLTGEILDFFGGREDMARGRIRHVNDISFGEDPLRVFRAAQFASRFGFRVAEETVSLASGMDVTALPSERVMGELEKALMKSEKPSIFFEALKDMNQLGVWFRELEALPEAAWRDTMAALDDVSALRKRAKEPIALMLSALCLWIDEPGELAFIENKLPATKRFLKRLTQEVRLTRYALNLILCHRRLAGLSEASTDAWMELFDASLGPEDLLLLERALGENDMGLIERMLELYTQRMAQPYLMGRDLVDAGIKPGPAFHDALACAHKLRLAGASKEEQMRYALKELNRGKTHD